MQVLKEQIGQSPKVKVTLSRDPEGSPPSRNQISNRDGKLKAKLSKRDSVFFKPTEKDNKVLGELMIKVIEAKPEST
jgi:hypothetical protein